eukprot:GHVR01059844.1.p1 GENE.GHVR01059844.1~~GHVR01059844.1.p1  ORF type:complete len:222 (+),score=88.63 GHVR01059844.1:54-719(+)
MLQSKKDSHPSLCYHRSEGTGSKKQLEQLKQHADECQTWIEGKKRELQLLQTSRDEYDESIHDNEDRDVVHVVGDVICDDLYEKDRVNKKLLMKQREITVRGHLQSFVQKERDNRNKALTLARDERRRRLQNFKIEENQQMPSVEVASNMTITHTHTHRERERLIPSLDVDLSHQSSITTHIPTPTHTHTHTHTHICRGIDKRMSVGENKYNHITHTCLHF